MDVEWVFQGFLSCREADKIIGSVYRLKGSVPELTHVLPIYDHPDDVSTYNGRSYVRKPPMWEEEADNWLREQNEIAKSFDTLADYAKVARTVIAITK